MAPQHQAISRQPQVATDLKVQDILPARASEDEGHAVSVDPASIRCKEQLPDSGFFDADDTISSEQNHQDFVLFPGDPPFIDEDDASMIVNTGSLYNGMSNERVKYIQNYTAFNYEEGPKVSGSHQTSAGPQRAPPQSFFYANYEAAAGETMLSQWASTYHRHEDIAYRFEYCQSTDSQGPSQASSPTKRHKSSKAGKARRGH